MTSIKSINTYLIVSVLLKFSCPKILQPLAEMILNPENMHDVKCQYKTLHCDMFQSLIICTVSEKNIQKSIKYTRNIKSSSNNKNQKVVISQIISYVSEEISNNKKLFYFKNRIWMKCNIFTHVLQYLVPCKVHD